MFKCIVLTIVLTIACKADRYLRDDEVIEGNFQANGITPTESIVFNGKVCTGTYILSYNFDSRMMQLELGRNYVQDLRRFRSGYERQESVYLQEEGVTSIIFPALRITVKLDARFSLYTIRPQVVFKVN